MNFQTNQLKQDSNQGFTLISVLMAVVMLASIAVVVSGLIGRAEKLSGVGREKFIATNIAREGIELVQVMRDTNWFGTEDRTRWMDNSLCTQNGVGQGDVRQFTLDTSRVRNSDGVGDIRDSLLYINPTSAEWTHTASSQVTPYSRAITIDCRERSNDPGFVIVTAKVTWKSRGQDRDVVITEKLFNWLPATRAITPS